MGAKLRHLFLKISQEFDNEIDGDNYEVYEIEDGSLIKEIILDHDTIYPKISRKHLEIDINKQELQRFLLIFQEIVKLTYLDEEFFDSEDGITTLVVGLAKQIRTLLEKDIDSLKFSAIIKNALKTLKALLNLFTTAKKKVKKQLRK